MTNIMIAFPTATDGEKIRAILQRRGYDIAAVCSSGSAALQSMQQLGEGIVISAYRFRDMTGSQLAQTMPSDFEMIMVASQSKLAEDAPPQSVSTLAMPLSVAALTQLLEELTSRQRPRSRKPGGAAGRRKVDNEEINAVKQILMERRGITEPEAHRYLQKTSMDNGSSLLETARRLRRLLE